MRLTPVALFLFLKDGILMYKKKWGFKITEDRVSDYYIKILNKSPGILSFLENNPYIVIGKEGNSAVFYRQSEELTTDTFKKLQGKSFPKGLDWVIINVLDDNARPKQVLKIPINSIKNIKN